MQAEKLLPWQSMLWQSVVNRKKQDRLPHALLFTGVDGIGKKEFARHLANYLLCNSPENEVACGHCKACRLLLAGSHPDYMQISPEEGAQQIKIDQIRETVHFVNETALLGGYRVIVIEPAAAMNVNAANALLKTLEEPTPDTLLILICRHGSNLPATIASRCQKMIFLKPERETALKWLATTSADDASAQTEALSLAGGAPLLARDYLINGTVSLRRDLYDALVGLGLHQGDPLQVAMTWEEKDIRLLFTLLLVWTRDLLRYKLTGSCDQLINLDYDASIRKLAEKIEQNNLLEYVDMLQKMYAQVSASLNMNRQLMLKEIFIRWVKLC